MSPPPTAFDAVRHTSRRDRRLAEVQVVQEAERNRLAQELHDALGQELAGARFALAAATAQHRAGHPGVAQSLESTAGMLASATDTTVRIVNALRPRVLEQLGLRSACEWLVRTTGEAAGLTWRFERGPPSSTTCPSTSPWPCTGCCKRR